MAIAATQWTDSGVTYQRVFEQESVGGNVTEWSTDTESVRWTGRQVPLSVPPKMGSPLAALSFANGSIVNVSAFCMSSFLRRETEIK